jgi:copper homeostasis protein
MPTSVLGKRITLEVCVTTADEARTAAENGADRLELCSALEVGGVTPSLGTFYEVRAAVTIPVAVLVRPRPGGFVYTRDEFVTLCRDADWFLAGGVEAVVCGVLDRTGRLDTDRCRGLVRLGGRVVLHRAFDFLTDQSAGLEQAIDLGFARVLTSGGAVSAVEGADSVRGLVDSAGGRIGVLPGGGIRPGNVAELVRATGCEQVHASLRVALTEHSQKTVLATAMGASSTTSGAEVAAVRAELDHLAAG